ncbi:MAG: alcohol dehydrogenase catalytic domain-containing protein [Chitinivibrionales bacterium]|nr:alcohol dehydrogenase catalytic domain-containing protein [Chitinivibrionales bacterium]MBD3394732.1 alcohol dehydrogenase catalytic domain-containing protein [Chitinivibrionales bacterium]
MKMHAAVLHGARDMRYEEVDKPSPGRGEVLVKVESVGLCGTDLEMYNGTMPYFVLGMASFPIILGHEWAGVIEAVGDSVKNKKSGDRVVGDVSNGCGICEYCMRGLYNLCIDRQEVGLTNGKNGAYAQYVAVPEQYTYILPEEVPFDVGAMTESTATVVKSIHKCPVKLGDRVLVQGDGPIGLLAMQAAVAAGSSYTFLSGTVDMKLEIGAKLGASRVVNIRKEDLAEVIGKETDGEGVDNVIEASGNPEAYRRAVELVKQGGWVNAIGLYEKNVDNLNIGGMVARDVSVIGSIASPNAYRETIRLFRAGKINPRPLISHTLPLKEIDEGMRILGEETETRLKIVMKPWS